MLDELKAIYTGEDVDNVISRFPDDLYRSICRAGNDGEIKEAQYIKGTWMLTKRPGRYNNPTLTLTGSIHKYKNDNEHNYDRLTYSEIVEQLQRMQDELGLNLTEWKLQNLAYGVNIEYPANLILDGRLLHFRGSRFKEYATKVDGEYYGSESGNRYLKIYDKARQYQDKARQYQLDHPVTRVEDKIVRHRPLLDIGIKTIADLFDKEALCRLGDELLKTWSAVVMVDPHYPDRSDEPKGKASIQLPVQSEKLVEKVK